MKNQNNVSVSCWELGGWDHVTAVSTDRALLETHKANLQAEGYTAFVTPNHTEETTRQYYVLDAKRRQIEAVLQ